MDTLTISVNLLIHTRFTILPPRCHVLYSVFVIQFAQCLLSLLQMHIIDIYLVLSALFISNAVDREGTLTMSTGRTDLLV